MRITVAVLLISLVMHVALVVALARSFIRPPRFKVRQTPAAYGLKYQDVTVRSGDGIELKGWYVPGTGRAGIVLCHGFPMNREDVIDFLPWLHRAGLHVLAFDFRALGESGGSLCTFGHREQDDVAAAAEALAKMPGVDPEQVGAMGLSMGGASVLLAAAKTPVIRAVVTDSAFARLDEMVQERFRTVPAFYRGALSASVRLCAERWAGYVARDIAPVVAARQIAPRPLLIIHGTADGLVPLRHARQLRDAAEGPVELWEIKDARHVGCHAAAPLEYERRVVEFFRRELAADKVTR